MGSMVVGVVVSAFLFTPFFVCHEHRHKRLSQRLRPVTAALQEHLRNPALTRISKQAQNRDPVIPPFTTAGIEPASNRKAQN